MTADRHFITGIDHEIPITMPHGGFRSRCTCGWSSDCYAQISDAQRAADVHQRRAKRLEFDALINKSSIGAALRDIADRGVDAHAEDLARQMPPRRRKRK